MRASLHHIAMRTGDVERLADFYRAMFDLDVVRENLPHSVWLAVGPDAVLMIELRAPHEPAPAQGSMDLVALRVDEAGKADVRRRASDRGCYDGETEFTVYLRDPDDRRVGASTYELFPPLR